MLPVAALRRADGATPRPYQVDGAAYAVARRRAIIGDEMGVGKTLTALAAVETAHAYPCVVVCPRQLKSNWEREINDWLPHRTVTILHGSHGPVKQADITVINYEILHARKLPRLRGLVVDELHFIKEPDSRRTRAVAALTARVPADGLVIMMSGTPFVNRPRELIEPLVMLGALSRDHLAPNGTEQFLWRFAGPKRGRGRQVDFDGSSNEVALNIWLRKVMIRRLKRDVLPELGQKRRREVQVSIQAADYAEYENRARQLVEGKLVWDGSTSDWVVKESGRGDQLVMLNMLRQFIGKAKVQSAIPWILEFCKTGKSLVVFADHVDVQHAIIASLKRHGITVAELLADTNDRDVQAGKDDFQAGQAQVIVCSLKAANVGHTLTAASDVLFTEYGYTPAEHDQGEDRLHRMGQANPVTAHYLSAAGTIDEWSYSLIEKKRRIFEAVLNQTRIENGAELESIENELLAKLRAKYGRKEKHMTGEHH